MGVKQAGEQHRRSWLAAHLRGEQPTWDEHALDSVDALWTSAANEGVLSLLAEKLLSDHSPFDPPVELQMALSSHARLEVAVELLRREELRRVVAAFEVAAVPVLLLKGSALAYSVYPLPHLRPRCDTDLIVADKTAAGRAREALLEIGYDGDPIPAAGVTSFEASLARVAVSGRMHFLDLHWALVNHSLFAHRFEFDELLAEAMPLPAISPGARGLGWAHALITACSHRAANMPLKIGDRLIWLYDLHLLALKASPADWEHLVSAARLQSVAGPCGAGLRSAMREFSTPVPVAALEELQRHSRSEPYQMRWAHSRAYLEWHNLRAMPVPLRRTWIREKLLPNKDYMRLLYPVEHAWDLPLAHMRRLAKGLRLALRTLFS